LGRAMPSSDSNQQTAGKGANEIQCGAYMSPLEIDEFHPDARPPLDMDRRKPLRDSLIQSGQYSDVQMAGRMFPIACVALEVTQRCNLDCSLCYLSEIAEAIRDVPLAELQRRIDMIHNHYGDGTNVQITGGDPTLRSADDLIKIVRYIRQKKMRSALMTNGIKATRDLLKTLAEAGLNDIVFHVDMTQHRKGYATEAALDVVREEYIKRAEGLGLRILFNTTVFAGNFASLPGVVRFFVRHAEEVYMASFQMQADTGRGVLRQRDSALISQQTVIRQIEDGTGCALPFDAPAIGHSSCNKYTSVLVSGGAVSPLYDDPELFSEIFEAVASRTLDWNDNWQFAKLAAGFFIRHPSHIAAGLRYIGRKVSVLHKGALQGRGRISRINFFIHNFMDAEKLEHDRCESCVFKVATVDGPLSMCVHNAKRDSYIAKPFGLKTSTEIVQWNPVAGFTTDPKMMPTKHRKGRMREKPTRRQA